MQKYALLFVLFALFPTAASAAGMNTCPQVGIYTSTDINKKQQDLGVKFDHVLKFQTINKLDHAVLTKFLDAGMDVVLNIEFQDTYANLKDIAAGKYDMQLEAFAKAVKADGRMMWIRPLHEANGDWYNWAVFYDPTLTTMDYKAAFSACGAGYEGNGRAAEVSAKPKPQKRQKIKIRHCQEFHPGDTYVDMVTITNYNRAYTTKHHQFWRTFAEDFEAAYRQVAAMTTRPIGIAEMSSTSTGGDKAAWITEAFDAIASKYPRVHQLTWFAYNRPVNGQIWDWDLNSDAEKKAFKEGVAALRKARDCTNQ